MRRLCNVGVLALSVVTLACAGREPPIRAAPAGVDAIAAWERMKQGLPGTWVATVDGAAVEVSYRVVSRGSSILETYGAAAERQTLSVYHPDGRTLMLTHYCGQGNQVRLRASEASPDRVTFQYLDATNVGAGQSVMHTLVFVLGRDTLDRTEIYRALDGTAETSVMHFVRR
jgi:hypothetical protein